MLSHKDEPKTVENTGKRKDESLRESTVPNRGRTNPVRIVKQPEQLSFTRLNAMLSNDSTAYKIREELDDPTNKQQRQSVIDVLTIFDQSTKESKNAFQLKCKNEPPFVLKHSEMGFEGGAVTKNPRLDIFWTKMIQRWCLEVGGVQDVGVKMIKNQVKKRKVYRKFYITSTSNDIYQVNEQRMNELFTNGIVNQRNQLFISMLKSAIENYFIELQQALNAILKVMKHKVLASFFERHFMQDDRLLRDLWQKYKKFSSPAIRSDKQELFDFVQRQRERVPFGVAKVLYTLVYEKYSAVRLDAVVCVGQGLYVDVVQSIDAQICRMMEGELYSYVAVEGYEFTSTQLLLLFFPFHHFDRDLRHLHSDQPQLRKVMLATKSDCLEPLRLLLQADGKRESERTKMWLTLLPNCSFGDHQWKKWLGLFLQIHGKIIRHQELEHTIIKLCKKCVAIETSLFWEIGEMRNVEGANQAGGEWAKKRADSFYLIEIMQYLKTMLNEGKITQALPILTKSLGARPKSFVEEVIALDGVLDAVKDIILKIHNNFQEYRDGGQRIQVYGDFVHVEQQVKFLSRLITLGLQDIASLQQRLLNVDNANGVNLFILLVRCVQELGFDSEAAVKSVRYAVEAITQAFFYVGTRRLLLYAICLCHDPRTNILRELASYCSQPPSETARQANKLRRMISLHLNSIVRLSDCLEDYFPLECSPDLSRRYQQLGSQMKKNMQGDNELQMSPLIATKWFYSLALILQSKVLDPIDYETIRLLVMKMRVKDSNLPQYQHVEVIVNILNRGNLPQLMVQVLAPALAPRHTTSFLDLCNQQYTQGELRSLEGFKERSPKYRHNKYKARKASIENKRIKNSVLGCICGVLNLIQITIKLLQEANYPLLKKTTLYSFVTKSILDPKHLHQYQRKFVYSENAPKTTVLEKINQPNTQKPVFELIANINIIHVICSLLDFEERYAVDRKVHKNKKSLSMRTIDLTVEEYANIGEIDIQLNFVASQSILNLPFDCFYGAEYSLGCGSVLRLLSSVFLARRDLLYESIVHRNYPLNKQYDILTGKKQNIEKMFLRLTNMLMRSSIKQQQQIFDFLIVCSTDSRLSAILVQSLQNLKDAINAICSTIEQKSLPLISKLIIFLQQILSKSVDPAETVRVLKSILVEPIWLFKKIVMSFNNKYKVNLMQETDSIYMHYHYLRKVNESSCYQLTLLALMSISTHFVLTQSKLFVTELMDIIINATTHFLQPQPLPNYPLYLPTPPPNSHTNIFLSILSSSGKCIGTQYLYHPIDAYFQLKAKNTSDLRTEVLKVFQCNVLCALKDVHTKHIQFTCTFLVSLLRNGLHGYTFSSIAADALIGDSSSLLATHRYRFPNRLNAVDVFGSSEVWNKGTRFIRTLLEIAFASLPYDMKPTKKKHEVFIPDSTTTIFVLLIAHILQTMSVSLLNAYANKSALSRQLISLSIQIHACLQSSFSVQLTVQFEALSALVQLCVVSECSGEVVHSTLQMIVRRTRCKWVQQTAVQLRYFEDCLTMVAALCGKLFDVPLEWSEDIVVLAEEVCRFVLKHLDRKYLLSMSVGTCVVMLAKGTVKLQHPPLMRLFLQTLIPLLQSEQSFTRCTVYDAFSQVALHTALFNALIAAAIKPIHFNQIFTWTDLKMDDIVQRKIIFKFLCALSHDWVINAQLLEQIFIQLVNHPFSFNYDSIPPMTAKEKEFANTFIYENRQNIPNATVAYESRVKKYNEQIENQSTIYNYANRIDQREIQRRDISKKYPQDRIYVIRHSLLSLLAAINTLSLVQYYTILLRQCIGESESMKDLLTSTISLKLSQLTWERLHSSLVHIVGFLRKIASVFSHSIAVQVAEMIQFLKNDPATTSAFYLINCLWDNYDEELVIQTVCAVGETVCLVINAGRTTEWKNKHVWRHQRIDLLNKCKDMLRHFSHHQHQLLLTPTLLKIQLLLKNQ